MGTSPFFGIEVGLRALQSYKLAMEVIAHNVANANTPGYSRQRVNLTATEPYTHPSFVRPLSVGQIGTGVRVVSIERLWDMSVARQVRTNIQLLEEYRARENMFKRIEVVFNEPGSVGLGSLMNDFFNSFQELSASPESSIVRAQVVQKGKSLCDYFNKLAQELLDLRRDVDNNVRIIVNDINTKLHQIADTNKMIVGIVPTGDNPNDLFDRRDLLLEELSELSDIEVVLQDDGTANVYIGGMIVVQRDIVTKLEVVDNPNNNYYASIKAENNLGGSDVVIDSGELKGLLDIRDSEEIGIPHYQSALDNLAKAIVEKVNNQHRLGAGLDGVWGRDFFDPLGITALSMDLSSAILDPVEGLRRVAAAGVYDTDGDTVPDTAGGSGDGSNALAIAQLHNDRTAIGSQTFSEYYDSFISYLGMCSRTETHNVENEEFLFNQLANFKDAVFGVSLDEEAAKLIEYQNSFNASAQLITIMNDMYQTLIDMLK
ncbi:MAG: flagellar hook-associated protein FlgK [Candidatus Omnitrophica bacterium]|nr:flagellar hook-associated protein FlgK [Candidatus Omnitrophota bacterium]